MLKSRHKLWFLYTGAKSIVEENESLDRMTFYRDYHWYAAILLAVIFWGLYGVFIAPLHFNHIIESPNIFLFSVLLYPLLEEIVFRGVIQEYLSRQHFLKTAFMGLSYSNILTSVLFSLSHLFNQTPTWALLVFFPSLIFGYFKDRHKNIISCILLHMIFNLGFFIFIV